MRHTYCGGAVCSVPSVPSFLFQGISSEGDTDPDGGLSLEEFTRYLQEREQRLLLMFHSLDRNQDGEKGSKLGDGQMG